MSHTFSRTWKSSEQEKKEMASKEALKQSRANATELNLQREHYERQLLLLQAMYKEGEAMVPWTFEEWIDHRTQSRLDEHRHLKQRIASLELAGFERRALKKATGLHKVVFGLAARGPCADNVYPQRSSVLCEQTIWCEYWDSADRFGAKVWPDSTELKYEGDERISGEKGQAYRRFLPLVRAKDPENDTTVWSLRPRLTPFPFDDVDRKKVIDDVYFPAEEINEYVEVSLLGTGFVRAIEMLAEEEPGQ